MAGTSGDCSAVRPLWLSIFRFHPFHFEISITVLHGPDDGREATLLQGPPTPATRSPEVLVSERPAEAADRAVPGHWEGDFILGLDSSAIGTLVERTTRFTMLLLLPSMPGHGDGPREKNGPALAGHGAAAVRDAIAREITSLPEQLRRSLTWDQGAEMAQHARLRIDTGLAASTSATRTVHGSAARTRTPTGCCGSIFRRARTFSEVRTPSSVLVASGRCAARSLDRVQPLPPDHVPGPCRQLCNPARPKA